MKNDGWTIVHASPDPFSAASAWSCDLAIVTGESAAAPSTDSLTTCFTPAFFAASTTPICCWAIAGSGEIAR